MSNEPKLDLFDLTTSPYKCIIGRVGTAIRHRKTRCRSTWVMSSRPDHATLDPLDSETRAVLVAAKRVPGHDRRDLNDIRLCHARPSIGPGAGDIHKETQVHWTARLPIASLVGIDVLC
jgi:hypothetical protein